MSGSVRNDQLHAELDAITQEFGLAAPSDDAGSALSTLDATIAGSEFAGASSGDSASFSMLGVGDDPVVDEMFFGWIKDKARKLIERLIKLAKKYRNCPKCIAHVTAAVAAFKSGHFVAAIAAAAKAVACFRSCAN